MRHSKPYQIIQFPFPGHLLRLEAPRDDGSVPGAEARGQRAVAEVTAERRVGVVVHVCRAGGGRDYSDLMWKLDMVRK